MNRLVKILLKITGVFIALIIVLWLGVAAYVTINKKEILNKITIEINESISGNLTIESMEPSLVQGFPGVAVLLKNVQLRDSLYNRHHHDLIRAKQIYVAVNSYSLLIGKPSLQSLTIQNGEIYVFTDSAGYKNVDLFKSGETGEKGAKPRRKIHGIKLENVQLTYDNQQKDKLFSFSFEKLDCKINYYPTKWNAQLNMRTRVNSLTFKKEKGSFVKGKLMSTELDLEYDHQEHSLKLARQAIYFDNDKLMVGGKFFFAPHSSKFILQVSAANIGYKNAISLLTPKIAEKLNAYSMGNPFAVDAELIGQLKGYNIPLVKVNWTVENAKVGFPGDVINNCSLKGTFTNELKKGVVRKDPNSGISFYNVKGNWRGIDFKSDTLQVLNLKEPILQGRFISDFPLQRISNISGSQSFNLSGGSAALNLWYRAPISAESNVKPYLIGSLRINNGTLNYYPRNIVFNNIKGQIDFKGADLFMRNFQVQTKRSRLMMSGSIRNFANFYYTSPSRINIDWNINSPKLELQEFVAFLGARKQVNARYSKNRIGQFFRQMNRVLDEASVHLELSARQLNYKRFAASNTHANLYLQQNALILKDISFNHAGGKLALSGDAEQKNAAANNFHLVSKLDKVDIASLFYAFEDFGQQSITNKNIRGRFSALVSMNGRVSAAGTIVPASFKGSVKFNLKNGALIGYEPLEKVGKFAFPKRDFSNINIYELSNTLAVDGNKIRIPEMTVMTSVLNMIIEGVYGIPTGTNIALQIPLRNPEKDKELADSLKEKRVKRGIVLNLTAMDDENGVLKIKLGKRDDEEEEKKDENRRTLSDDRNKLKRDTLKTPR